MKTTANGTTAAQVNNNENKNQVNNAAEFVPIYDRKAAFISYDGFNNGNRELVPVLVEYKGRRRFVFNFTDHYTTRESHGGFYDLYEKESRDNVADYFRQLNENGGKYFAFYCADWSTVWSKQKKKDLFVFLEWIKANGYTFDKDMTDFSTSDGYTDFSGNLNEYSAAFFFRIYDDEMAADLMAKYPDIKRNDYTKDTDPTPEPSGEGETEAAETWQAGRVTVTKTADTITTTENGKTDVFEIVTEWPANYYVWSIGREHFPVMGYLPLCKDGVNVESWQRNIDPTTLKAIKVQSEAAALACFDYAHHHDRDTREDYLKVLANFPTDPTPEPSGEGEDVTICHSYETGAPYYSNGEKSEADPLADIIKEAKQQEARTVSGLNYGPIKYLRDRVLYATNGKTTAENMTEYENNLHRVTDPDTYAAYLLSSYDVFADETQVFCDLRRAFPSLTFAELCRLIRDHMGDNQQGNGIAAALVPDVVILSSSDEYTREKFRERHEKFYKLSSYWKGEEVNTNRERDLKKYYDRESLAVHFLLSHELFYSWTDNRHREDCLKDVCAIYPDMTAQELHNIRDKYADAVGEIYG